MASTFELILHTIRYLQPTQVYHQLWYRLKNRKWKTATYDGLAHTRLGALKTITRELIPANGKYLGNHRFSFLNLQHQFEEDIQWNWNNYGKLWNYNLQYFDYLQDESLTDDQKQALILSFSEQYLSKNIQPEPYPVSLRLINWALYVSKSDFSNHIVEKAFQQQADYLQNNLEFHIQANHLLENYFALVVAGVALNEEALLRKGYHGMKQQLKEQILADGAHYECSPMYHQIILSKLLLVTDVLIHQKITGFDIPFLKQTAAGMLGWMLAFNFKNRHFALMNDATVHIAPDAHLLLHNASLLGIAPIPVSLGASGYRKWEIGDMEVLIDAGNIMPSYQPGHAHSDMLHFCVQFQHQPLLVDTGISTYQTNERRQEERRTAAHNTVTINGEDQSEVWGSFRVGNRAMVQIDKEESGLLSASHNGYLKKFGVTHHRTFQKLSDGIMVTDTLSGKSPQKGVARFHFDHQVSASQLQSGIITTNAGVRFQFDNADKLEMVTYQQALAYNQLTTAYMVQVTFAGTMKTTIQQI